MTVQKSDSIQRNNVILRRFRRSDANSIVELFKIVFKADFTWRWWEWKYIHNPSKFRGEEGDIWVGETRDGQIIGHWAVIPEELQIGKQMVTVGQAVDAATHPDFRGRGIFKNLVNRTLADTKKRYRFVFGFPNELYRGYENLGWKSFRMVDFLAFINFDSAFRKYFKNKVKLQIAKTALAILRAKNSLLSRPKSDKTTYTAPEIKEINIFSKKADEFWSFIRTEHKMIIKRDSAFLNWRFSRNLGDYQKFITFSETGEMVGFFVIKKTEIRGIKGILEIVDLQTLPNESETLISILKFVIEKARAENLNIIYCRIPFWHKYSRFLRKLGFIPMGKMLEYAGLYQPRLILCPLEKELDFDVNTWFYTLADTDYA